MIGRVPDLSVLTNEKGHEVSWSSREAHNSELIEMNMREPLLCSERCSMYI